MTAQKVLPDETHVIKATAWDAFYAAWQIRAESPEVGDTEDAQHIMCVMSSLLEQVGQKYMNADTWGFIMPKKFSSVEFYMCRACNKAGQKEDWRNAGLQPDWSSGTLPYFICPYCGTVQDISVVNMVDERIEQTSPIPTEPKIKAKK